MLSGLSGLVEVSIIDGCFVSSAAPAVVVGSSAVESMLKVANVWSELVVELFCNVSIDQKSSAFIQSPLILKGCMSLNEASLERSRSLAISILIN